MFPTCPQPFDRIMRVRRHRKGRTLRCACFLFSAHRQQQIPEHLRRWPRQHIREINRMALLVADRIRQLANGRGILPLRVERPRLSLRQRQMHHIAPAVAPCPRRFRFAKVLQRCPRLRRLAQPRRLPHIPSRAPWPVLHSALWTSPLVRFPAPNNPLQRHRSHRRQHHPSRRLLLPNSRRLARRRSRSTGRRSMRIRHLRRAVVVSGRGCFSAAGSFWSSVGWSSSSW